MQKDVYFFKNKKKSAVTDKVTPPVTISTRNHNFAYDSCPPYKARRGSVGGRGE